MEVLIIVFDMIIFIIIMIHYIIIINFIFLLIIASSSTNTSPNSEYQKQSASQHVQMRHTIYTSIYASPGRPPWLSHRSSAQKIHQSPCLFYNHMLKLVGLK